MPREVRSPPQVCTASNRERPMELRVEDTTVHASEKTCPFHGKQAEPPLSFSLAMGWGHVYLPRCGQKHTSPLGRAPAPHTDL